MSPDAMTYDYDGFGPSVLRLTDCYVHERGAWRWKVTRGRPYDCDATYVREALPREDLERLRETLERALEIVERQIEVAP